MPFLAGSVSFCRFQIVGGSPKRLDDALLDKLRGHVIGADKSAHVDGVEVGWIGGRHILDREFTDEKNVILDCLHFAMRMDVAKPPAEIMKAYFEQELAALREENTGARANARIRREATDAAKKRIAREVKDGRYLRMKQVPVLMDSRSDTLYVGATQSAIHERLYNLFKETFGKRLEPLTAGTAAYVTAERMGRLRALESMQPSIFVKRPDRDDINEVYWTSHDSSSRDYLGNEFLLWLWHHLVEENDTLALVDKTEVAVMIARQLTLECPWAQTGKETITADGPAHLPEARRAVQSGKLPRRAGLTLSRQSSQYELTLAPETLAVSGGVLPKPERNDENPRAMIEERVEQVRHLAETVDLLFAVFLEKRLSSDWPTQLNRIVSWLRKGE